VGCSFRVLGVGWGEERDLVVSMSESSLVVYVRMLK